MATTGRKQVAPGQLIQSSAWGNPLWDQSVQCFNSAADRDNQYPPASWHNGAVVWLDDIKQHQTYNGTTWRALGSGITTSGAQMVGAGFNPAVHRPWTFLWHTSVTTNQFGQVAVPVVDAGFVGYMGMHATPNNRPWFPLVDFANTPSLTNLILIMRDTAGPAVNASVDLNVTVPGWK